MGLRQTDVGDGMRRRDLHPSTTRESRPFLASAPTISLNQTHVGHQARRSVCLTLLQRGEMGKETSRWRWEPAACMDEKKPMGTGRSRRRAIRDTSKTEMSVRRARGMDVTDSRRRKQKEAREAQNQSADAARWRKTADRSQPVYKLRPQRPASAFKRSPNRSPAGSY